MKAAVRQMDGVLETDANVLSVSQRPLDDGVPRHTLSVGRPVCRWKMLPQRSRERVVVSDGRGRDLDAGGPRGRRFASPSSRRP